MPLTIHVSLLSGRTVLLEAGPEETVEALRSRAQKTLAAGRGRLLNASGCILDGALLILIIIIIVIVIIIIITIFGFPYVVGIIKFNLFALGYWRSKEQPRFRNLGSRVAMC